MKKPAKVTVSLLLSLVFLLGTALPISASSDSFTQKVDGYVCGGTLTFTPSNNSASADLTIQQVGGKVTPYPTCKLSGNVFTAIGKPIASLSASGDLYCSASTTYGTSEGVADYARCYYYFCEVEVDSLLVD